MIRPRHYRAGTTQLRSIRKFQKLPGLLIPRSAFAAILGKQRDYPFPRDPEVVRLLRLQSLTAHRREPPEPSLPLNLLRNIFDFLPVWIPPRELDALQECAESYAVGLLQDSLLLAIHRHSADSNGAFESAECHGACHGAVWPLDVETAWRINGSGTVFSGEVSTAEGSLAAATASVAEPMDASQQLCRS